MLVKKQKYPFFDTLEVGEYHVHQNTGDITSIRSTSTRKMKKLNRRYTIETCYDEKQNTVIVIKRVK